MKVYLVRPRGESPPVIHRTWEEVLDCIQSGPEVEEWVIRIADLTEEEIDSAPEFEGW